MASSSSPPSFTCSNWNWKYEVFLSFRGDDTRRNFTGHLYDALKRQGIKTFRDDEELESGKPISENIIVAIEQSRIALVVFSKNFATSSWCLDEVVKICECMKVMGQTVLPVFYDVGPSDVRKQSGSFGEAFIAHEERFKDQPDKVQSWRAALLEIGNLSGFHLQKSVETEFIQRIVQKTVSLCRTPQNVSKDLVGIDSRLKDMTKLCSGIKDHNDVGFVGIWGMGGIGKTTLAECVCDQICHQFDEISFLKNVRESAERIGLDNLRERILSDLHIKIWEKGRAWGEIEYRLSHKKVLIILDDVDKLEQLESLAGSHNWFGQGSRIIITTRNKHLLTAHGVIEIYEATKLNGEEALKLFTSKAFKNGYNVDKEKYRELSQNFVTYAKGLPLAIIILGRSLCGRSLIEWKSTFARNKEDLEDGIMKVLERGFDVLKKGEKNIFLDIACFFKGKHRVYASMVFDSFGFFPDISISILIDKSLVTIVEGRLWMHDLVQEMGWKIIRRKCPEEPEKWSRLWHWEDVLDVLKNNKGTNAVEGIVLNLPHETMAPKLSRDAFSKMKKLRFLKISGVLLPQDLNYLPDELGYFEWHGYPSKFLPPNFPSGKLVQLNMHGSQIKLLWKGMKALAKLKSIELIDSENLIETPDFTGVPNLERLILKGCKKLHKIHQSIGTLKRLVLLNMENCKSLESLPERIILGSLETLVLSGCSRLKRFPEIVGDMEYLSKLYLDGTALKELPLSINHLRGLTLLYLKDCRNLLCLPGSISRLTSLKHLILSGCTSLEQVPEEIGDLESLEELDVSETGLTQLPLSIGDLRNLKVFSCSGCNRQLSAPAYAAFPRMGLLLPPLSGLSLVTSLNLSYCNLLDGAIPEDLNSLPSLRHLRLRGNNFTTIPSIDGLAKLEQLSLTNCSNLQSLPKLPASLERVSAYGCNSLRPDSDQFEVWDSWHSAEQQFLQIIIRSRSHTYELFLSADQYIPWLERDLDHKVATKSQRPKCGISAGADSLPEWFTETSSRSSSVTINLPRELDGKRLQPWIGYVLYVCFKVDDNFDTNCAFKVTHKFDCYLDANLKKKETIYTEMNVKGVPFTGRNGYWLYATHAWFSRRLKAWNECRSIKADTTTDCPSSIQVKMSGVRLLFVKIDFKPFIESVSRNSWVPLKKSRNPGSSSTSHFPTSTEDPGNHADSGSIMTLKQRLESLPLQSYESLKPLGGRRYIIEGNLDNPLIASALGKILQECSGNDIFYTTCFPQCKFPNWFSRGVSDSDLKKDWKGIAVCVAFTVHGPKTLDLNNLDMKYFLRTSTGLSEEKIHHVTTSTLSQLRRLKHHDFFWISYTSRGSFPDYEWSKCISMEVVYYKVTEDLRVHKSGYQLVFEDSVEGFVEAILQCSTTPESINFRNEGLTDIV